MGKIEGKVLKYDGYSGIIIDNNNYQYLIINNNIMENEKIKVNDVVLFLPELFKTIEVEEKVALFIEKKYK